jgi:hypothetical protein
MTSDVVRYEIKKLHYLILDLKILTFEKSGSGPYATNNEHGDQLILVDPVDDEEVEEIVHKLILQRLTMRDLKKWEELVHSS